MPRLLTEKRVLLKSNDGESKNYGSNELDSETIEEEVLALEEYVGGFEQHIKWIKGLNDDLKELEKKKCNIDKFVKEYNITELNNTRESIDEPLLQHAVARKNTFDICVFQLNVSLLNNLHSAGAPT